MTLHINVVCCTASAGNDCCGEGSTGFTSVWQVCNHPYLITGVEDRLTETVFNPVELAQHFISSSGKFVLLDKLLPKLKSGGHRVLIFSQMVKILDLLSDFLRLRRFVFERLDGSTRGNDRQVLCCMCVRM